MSAKIPCTVGILTKNSVATLERTLESVKDFSEIIICDGGSADATLAIARKYGARIMAQDKDFLDSEGYINNFSGVRNQTLEAASNDWYLFVDSDEYVSPELVASIRDIVATRHDGAFNVFRRYVLRGREVNCASSYPNRSMRFFSKRSVIGFRKIVHERPVLREGVAAEDLTGKLLVPVEEDRSKVWIRNDRYIALEVKRKGRIGLFKFLGYVRGEMRASAIYLIHLVHGYLFCSGVRLPLSMELGRHLYPLKFFIALWRARNFNYPPNVLFLINKWKTGGAEHVSLQEFEAFKRDGIAVSFATVYGGELPLSVDKIERITPSFKNLYDILAYVRLLRQIGDHGITHIVATLEHAIIIARVAAIFAPRVRVIIVESGMADRKPLRYKLLDILLNWRTSAIIAGSSGVLRSLGYQPMYTHHMYVLLNGVVVPVSLPIREEPNRFTALAVGSFRKEKAFDILLDAFADFLHQSGTDAELLLVGKGTLESALKKQAASLHISDNVRFLGQLPHDEVISAYAKAHCFVLSSISEGNPTVVMEALAQGIAVIATRVSGVEDYITDEESGLLVPIGKKEALARAMMRLYEDSMFRKKIAEGGYRCAKEKLSFERHTEGFKRILRI